MNPRIAKITIPTSQPKPFDSDSSGSFCTHGERQQSSSFPSFVVKALSLLQKVPDSHICPDISSHVSSLTSKFS